MSDVIFMFINNLSLISQAKKINTRLQEACIRFAKTFLMKAVLKLLLCVHVYRLEISIGNFTRFVMVQIQKENIRAAELTSQLFLTNCKIPATF